MLSQCPNLGEIAEAHGVRVAVLPQMLARNWGWIINIAHGVLWFGEIGGASGLCDHCIPTLEWEFVHWRNILDARVVDEHVDASKVACRMLDQPYVREKPGNSTLGQEHVEISGRALPEMVGMLFKERTCGLPPLRTEHQ